MIRAMGGTLRHAASSIFVTSFTTAAAFLTNYITKLPYVQLFGVFTGMCILIYFSMVITMVAAFVITYEKNIQPFRCKVRTKFTDKLESLFQRAMDYVSLLNFRVIAQWLPKMLIKFRVALFLIFLTLGVLGLLTVFVWPKLKPPSNWRYQFFKDGNLFEKFEFETKDQFSSYVNEEKRNLTNPEIFFVFGILNKDTGRIFNPDDDGHLLYDKQFDFFDNDSQVWLNNFINVSIASRPDLFQAEEIVQEWTSYLFQIQLFCHDIFGIDDKTMNKQIALPFPREKLIKCRETINSMLVDSTVETFEELMASFPRRIIFMSNGSDVNGLLLRINSNRMFTDYETVRDYYLALKKFHEETYANAPDGFKSGWFISIAFALYDLQYQLMTGTYSSLVASMGIALIILLLTSGKLKVVKVYFFFK
jgi:protein dispatched 1